MSHEGFSKQVGELSHFEAWWCYHFCHHVCIYIYIPLHCIASHHMTWHCIHTLHILNVMIVPLYTLTYVHIYGNHIVGEAICFHCHGFFSPTAQLKVAAGCVICFEPLLPIGRVRLWVWAGSVFSSTYGLKMSCNDYPLVISICYGTSKKKHSCSIIELAIGHGFHDKLLNYWKVLMPSFWGWPYRPWWFLELPGFFHRSIHHWKVKTEVPSKIYWDAN